MEFLIKWAALSDTGRQRDHNEDSFLADPYEGLWVVADGMGGHLSGEKASQLAVEAVHEFLVELVHDPAYASRIPDDPTLLPVECNMKAAVLWANDRILVEAMKDPRHQGMGTTITVALIHGDEIVLAHVGDSRIYRFRNGYLEQVTADHSLLNHMLATGQITPEQAHNFPKGNVILRALGLKEHVEVDVQLHGLVPGDIYLMCSDGLSDLVKDPFILQAVTEHEDDLNLACQRLVDLANQGGGRDNITVCLLQIIPNEQPTIVF